ncbi:MAG TPA: sigma-70 family RNA polymerase sigma factor [Kofleriaceae bacterium]|jgi:RNA polymerase sigma factor for flagellar operon FliA|nr:sigma-70 family RNA polymerase sigma factor [Kofleriaceae bacterium]
MSIARTSQDLTLILADVRARRDRLIQEHVGMAKRISMKMVRGSGPRVSRDDAVAAAMLGLTEAADRFDPTRGEPFVAFAEKRIRGAVLDELRRGDFLPRRVRRMARRAAQVRTELEANGIEVTDERVAAALGITADEYRDDIAPLADAAVTALETNAEVTCAWPSPATQAEQNQALDKITDAVEDLPSREAKILSMHYGDDLPYRAIAAELGLTASRVCQLHTRAIEKIRAAV